MSTSAWLLGHVQHVLFKLMNFCQTDLPVIFNATVKDFIIDYIDSFDAIMAYLLDILLIVS